MTSAQVERTLVKSPPELWAELSDPAALARHLGELGEIRITRIEPEHKVEWTAEGASGTVLIKPSAWGTRVTLTASRSSGEPESAPHASAPQPPRPLQAAGQTPARPSPPKSDPRPLPPRSAPESDPRPSPPETPPRPSAAESDSLHSSGRGEATGSPQTTPPIAATPSTAPTKPPVAAAKAPATPPSAAAPPPPSAAAPKPAAQAGPPSAEAEPPSSEKPAAVKPVRGFRARLRRWLRGPELDEAFARGTQVPQKPVVPAASPRAASHEGHVKLKARPPAALPTPEPTKSIAPAPSKEAQPAGLPSPAPTNASRPAPPREARPPAGLPTPEPTKAIAPGPAKEEPPASEPAGVIAPAPLERLAAEMPEVPATSTPRRERPDEVTAVLTSVLDSLGAAHHRPFSRS